MQLEYCSGSKGTIDLLKLWSSSKRGHWHLVCHYDRQTSDLVRFEQGFASAGLRRNLEFIMQNQTDFLLPQNRGRGGLLQIEKPTQQDADIAQQTSRAYLRITE